MKEKIKIICSRTDADIVDRLTTGAESNTAVETIIAENSVNSPVDDKDTVVILINSATPDIIYRIAGKRIEKGLGSINLFTEPTSLTAEQKQAIGKNRSVFHALSGDNTLDEIVSLLPTTNDTIVSEIPDNRVPTSVAETNNTVEIRIPSSNRETAETEESENSDDDDSTPCYRPWKAVLAMTIVNILVTVSLKAFGFKVDDILPYVIQVIGLLILFSCVTGVNEWRKQNGKSFFSFIVVCIGWLSIFLHSVCIVINLWNWLFP